MKKLKFHHLRFALNAEGKEDFPGETILFFIIVNVIYVREKLSQFILLIILKLFIVINAGGVMDGTLKVTK